MPERRYAVVPTCWCALEPVWGLVKSKVRGTYLGSFFKWSQDEPKNK